MLSAVGSLFDFDLPSMNGMRYYTIEIVIVLLGEFDIELSTEEWSTAKHMIYETHKARL